MSRRKLRIYKTALEVIIGHLRCEVGEAITTWLLYRHFWLEYQRRLPSEVGSEIGDPDLTFLNVLLHKLEDDLLAVIAELGERRIGRANFYFATEKLGELREAAKHYSSYVRSKGFKRRRDRDISHREVPQQWLDHRHIQISYMGKLRALAKALRLMKRIDRAALGPAAPYLWREMRKRRYKLMSPPGSLYMILPHFGLSTRVRLRILHEEVREGREVWAPMRAIVNGQEEAIIGCQRWGAFCWREQLFVLDNYPIHSPIEIDERRHQPITGAATRDP